MRSILVGMSDVTRILTQIEAGDPSAAEKLLPLVYDELRKLAASRLAVERPGQTLEATALVHEAYLRLVDSPRTQDFNSRGHFFGAASEAMRRILVEQARRKARVRHGGEHRRLEIPEVAATQSPDAETILAVNEAVARLAVDEPQTAEVVKLHFFAGLTLEETADAMEISRATVYRNWAYARAYLRLLLEENAGSE
jgi:RNA polymerase sigma factor (TIGR02999 family)